MKKEEIKSEIQIGRFLIRCPDEDGDYYIRVGGSSTHLGTEEMKDIADFINAHIKQL